MKYLTKKTLLFGITVALFCAIMIVGCAPKQAEPGAGEGGGGGEEGGTSVVEITWSPDVDCVTCHTPEGQSASMSTTAYGAHIATNATDVTCITCHNQESILQTVHEGATVDNMPKRLKKTEVAQESCVVAGCHDDEAGRITATAGSTILTDTQGTVVNPHDLPVSTNHASITCSSCHTGHKELDAMNQCLSCHHEGEFTCNTCH